MTESSVAFVENDWTMQGTGSAAAVAAAEQKCVEELLMVCCSLLCKLNLLNERT